MGAASGSAVAGTAMLAPRHTHTETRGRAKRGCVLSCLCTLSRPSTRLTKPAAGFCAALPYERVASHEVEIIPVWRRRTRPAKTRLFYGARSRRKTSAA